MCCGRSSDRLDGRAHLGSCGQSAASSTSPWPLDRATRRASATATAAPTETGQAPTPSVHIGCCMSQRPEGQLSQPLSGQTATCYDVVRRHNTYLPLPLAAVHGILRGHAVLICWLTVSHVRASEASEPDRGLCSPRVPRSGSLESWSSYCGFWSCRAVHSSLRSMLTTSYAKLHAESSSMVR